MEDALLIFYTKQTVMIIFPGLNFIITLFT